MLNVMRLSSLSFYRTLAFILTTTLIIESRASAPQVQILKTRTGPVKVERLVELDNPWGMTYLPDGQLLITEKPGNLRLYANGVLSRPIAGVPKVAYEGQGGLLDVEIDPEFAKNRLVYFSYAASAEEQPADPGMSQLKGGVVARGRLEGNRLHEVKIIWQQFPKTTGSGHFGGRLAFAPDGKLMITSGERQKMTPAQDLTGNLGKVIRINSDGTIPSDNPFINQPGIRPDIWSYGHRNPLGMAFHPVTKQLWINEMGPAHGDELNLIEPGKNFGWPIVSNGDHYDGTPIPDHATRPEFTAPAFYWHPAISPSGLMFYSGDLFKQWRGHAFIGGLSSETLLRLAMTGSKVTSEERIPIQKRVRDVIQGPDGSVLILTDGDEGELLRLTPAEDRGTF